MERRLELIVSKKDKKLSDCNFSLGEYNRKSKRILIDLRKLKSATKRHQEFIHLFNDALTHEIIHHLVNEEVESDKNLKRFYKGNPLKTYIGEEIMVGMVTSGYTKDSATHKYLEANLAKSHYYKGCFSIAQKHIKYLQLLVFMEIVFVIILNIMIVMVRCKS